MSRILPVVLLCLAACATPESSTQADDTGPAPNMTFFLTSVNPGSGADLGGLAGADAFCASLAENVGAGGKDWRAYLSTRTESARDRIGQGPWHNAAGVQIAANLEELHGENNLTKETQLDENGQVVNGRGDSPNRHDILTGSQADGTTFGDDGTDHTCGDWTGDGTSAQVGHHDRQGGGADPTSWNSAHGSRGCGLEDLRGTGGDGLFYCFATGSR